MTGAIPRWLLRETKEEGASREASLLMVALVLTLAGREPYPILIVGEFANRWAAVLPDVAQAICPSVELCAIADAKRDAVSSTVREHPAEVAWERPVGLLIVDGPRDYAAISQLFADFEPWIVAEGYVAFGEYDSRISPDITDFVCHLLDTERYRKVQVAGTIALLEKLRTAESPDGGRPAPDCFGSSPPASAPAAVLAATAGALRETLARTAWIERRGQLVDANRLEVIRQVRTTMEERTAWAERMVAEAEQRGTIIAELQQALAERTAWAERMVAEAEQRGTIIAELQRALAERGGAPEGG